MSKRSYATKLPVRYSSDLKRKGPLPIGSRICWKGSVFAIRSGLVNVNEVYQAYGDYETMMELLQGLVVTVAEVADHVVTLAAAEDLPGHAEAVSIRFGR